MRLLVTRPLEDAEALAGHLRDRGFETLIEPLLSIAYVTPGRLELEGIQGLVVTSANGVRAFSVHSERRDLPVFAVGDASARAAREAGFQAVESASGNIDALAQLLRLRAVPDGGALLHVAGSDVAGELGGMLIEFGLTYRRAVLYRALKSARLSEQTVTALRNETVDGILFFSPRTTETFVSLARKARVVRPCRRVIAVCLSAAVAERAGAIAWRATAVAARPDQESLIAVVESAMQSPNGVTGNNERTPRDMSKKPKIPADDQLPAKGGSADTQPSEPSTADSAVDEARGSEPPTEDFLAGDPETTTETGISDTEAPTPGPRPISRRSRAPAVFLWTALLLAVISGVAYAVWPFWSPYLAAYVETLQKDPFEDPRLSGVTNRLAELEEVARSTGDTGSALEAMEAERARFQGDLGTLIARVGELEKALQSVTKMVEATNLPLEAANTQKSLEQLSERIALLEEQGSASADKAVVDDLGTTTTRLSEEVADITRRVETLAESSVLAGRTTDDVRATIVAAGTLREALRGSTPFAEPLAEFKEIAGVNPDLGEIVALVEPYAGSGVPTLATLRRQFDGATRDITRAARSLEGDGWIARIVNRLANVISIRRTGERASENTVDAAVVRAEGHVAAGDLIAAVKELESLEGPPAEAAAPWLGDAHARVAAERAMALLHVHAMSLMSTTKK